jgi:hypothetical protein
MQRQLLDFYCRGDVEPVRSQLAAEQSDDVIFDILCASLAENRTELVEFIAATLAYVTFYVESGGMTSGAVGALWEQQCSLVEDSGEPCLVSL